VLTDAPPRTKNRALFVRSDALRTLELPPDDRLPELAFAIESAMRSGAAPEVRRACATFLDTAAQFYRVSSCDIRILAARPLRVRERSTTELFGDYHPQDHAIRIWMRTAVRKEVTSFGTLLSTLCHEFCHHLDFKRFSFPDSWHTRGFYGRCAQLYHHARRTPAKPLFWIPAKNHQFRIDWPRTNRGS
jgi:hypothetical protein